MKNSTGLRLLFALILLDLLIGGANGGLLPLSTAQAARYQFTSLNAAASTGAGSTFALTTESASGFTWTVVDTGTPASVNVNLEGSIDNVTYFTLDSSTTTTSEMRHVVNKDVQYLRCNLTTLTGGSSPTVTCKIFKGSREK